MKSLKKNLFIILTIHQCSALTFEEHFQKANDLFHNGQHEASIDQYKQALEFNPSCHQAYFNIGLVYAQQNNHQRAIESYLKALELCPTYLKAIIQSGNAYQELKAYDKAIDMYSKGLAVDKNSFDCVVGLARAQNNASNFEDSAINFRAALQHKPYDTNIMLELANTLNMANHTHQALDLYREILKSIPNNPSILYNIAYTLKKLNRISEAMPYYEKVLSLEPDNSEAHFSLGLAYLGQGNFEQGWKEYEWRWKRDNHGGPRVMSRPQWDGSSLDHKTILLHAEQGLGDTLQFIRYAQVLKERYAVKIIFASHDPLIPLIKLCPYIDHVVSLFEKVPFHDVQVPLLSMPYLCNTRLDSIPPKVPYLYADETLTQYWKEKMGSGLSSEALAKGEGQAFKIGICWQGNSNYSTHFLRTAVAAKSIQLQQFMPLFNVPNIVVYNLQKTTGEEQTKTVKECPSFISFDNDFDGSHGRFMDTAAVIKNLDLMITIDTSMAHLAGGLGIPTWILLPEPADWRWMIGRLDTPWYPNVRLFRQPTAGDWESVINTVINELKKLLEVHTLDQSIATTKQKINMLEQHKIFTEELRLLSSHLYALVQNRKQLASSGL